VNARTRISLTFAILIVGIPAIFFAVTLIPAPKREALSHIHGIAIWIFDPRGGRTGPRLNISLKTPPKGDVVIVEVPYDSVTGPAAHRLSRGCAIDVLAERGGPWFQKIWIAWDVRMSDGPVLTYEDFVDQKNRRDERFRILGVVAAAVGATIYAVSLWIQYRK
jgi:hypothetical protein